MSTGSNIDGCVFCKIVAGEIPARFVDKKPSWVAFYDINPQAPVHVLVLPRGHVPRLTNENSAWESVWEADILLRVVADVANTAGLRDYRVIINNGPCAGQQVMHLHAHILGGWAAGEAPPIVSTGTP